MSEDAADKSQASEEGEIEKVYQALEHMGENITLDGKTISGGEQPIEILMGVGDREATRALNIFYGENGWYITDPHNPRVVLPYLEDGESVILGRNNQALYPEGKKLGQDPTVSHKHLSIVVAGDIVTLMHLGKNPTLIHAPKNTILGLTKLGS